MPTAYQQQTARPLCAADSSTADVVTPARTYAGGIDFSVLRSTATRYGENHRRQHEAVRATVELTRPRDKRSSASLTANEPTSPAAGCVHRAHRRQKRILCAECHAHVAEQRGHAADDYDRNQHSPVPDDPRLKACRRSSRGTPLDTMPP